MIRRWLSRFFGGRFDTGELNERERSLLDDRLQRFILKEATQ